MKNSLAETKAEGGGRWAEVLQTLELVLPYGPRRDQAGAGGRALNIPEHFSSSILTKQRAILVITKGVCGR